MRQPRRTLRFRVERENSAANAHARSLSSAVVRDARPRCLHCAPRTGTQAERADFAARSHCESPDPNALLHRRCQWRAPPCTTGGARVGSTLSRDASSAQPAQRAVHGPPQRPRDFVSQSSRLLENAAHGLVLRARRAVEQRVVPGRIRHRHRLRVLCAAHIVHREGVRLGDLLQKLRRAHAEHCVGAARLCRGGQRCSST